jgi:hypothetical protein
MMAIDIEVEQTCPISAACRFPALRNPKNGKPAHANQVYRWVQIGARAVNGQRIRLEAIQLPTGLATSREAVARFIARLNDPDADIPEPTPAARRRQIDSAAAELEAAGFEVGAPTTV